MIEHITGEIKHIIVALANCNLVHEEQLSDAPDVSDDEEEDGEYQPSEVVDESDSDVSMMDVWGAVADKEIQRLSRGKDTNVERGLTRVE